jgi:sterol desaturase/sphingolipid hydroxylase (fatty acid hydroxylase superfamily)
MFWSCASRVTFWTAYEVIFLWAYANNMLPFYLDWTTHPVWFVLMFVAILFCSSFHFYFIHRLLHWLPLYKIAHAVHHRNDNIAPWSGLSMHPIEHVIYFSSVLIHVVLSSHPIHLFFHVQWKLFGAVTSHMGFDSLLFRGKPIFALGTFHLQPHHRYYHCNYGYEDMPCDKWLGSNHHGTPEALARMRARQRARTRAAEQQDDRC